MTLVETASMTKPILQWFLAPWVESWHGLSLTRLLATVCFVFVGHSVWEERALSWVDFSVLTLGVSAAFGKKVLLAFLKRVSIRAAPEIRFDPLREPNAYTDDER